MVYGLAYGLRFNFVIPDEELPRFLISLPAVVMVQLVVFYATGHCHRSWNYVSLSDLAAFLRASTVSVLLITACDHFMVETNHIRTSPSCSIGP